MPGFKPAKAMVRELAESFIRCTAGSPASSQVYAGIYPVDSNDFPKLEESIRRVRGTLSLLAGLAELVGGRR